MASRTQRPGPATDNRAQVANIGAPQAPTNDYAFTNEDNVVEGRSPEFSMSEFIPPSDVAAPQPTPEGQPAPAPATPEPAPAPATPDPAAAPATPAKDEDKFASMPPEELRKLARHQEQMIGRQSEEVGTYRKLFDKLHTPTPPQSDPVDPMAKFLKSKLSEDEKQELIALALTDHEKHEEIQFARFQQRQEAMDRQRRMVEEAKRVRDIVTTPEFAKFEKTLPPSIIQSAMHDPNVLHWVVSQFQGTPAPTSAPPPAPPIAPAPMAPPPAAPVDRVVRLGNAGGAPSAGVPANSAPTFTRLQLAKMMTEAPEEYAARQPEILRAYREGRVR